jgi:hypothetical protein
MKEHPVHKGYFVTEDGRVFSAWQRKANPGFGNSFYYVIDTNKMRELKSWDNKKGYLVLNLKGSKKNWYVHRLVAESYLPNSHNLPQINHKNKNTKDNSVTNLEWCTASENMKHCAQSISYDRKLLKAKRYLLENVLTKERFEVLNLAGWCRENGLSDGTLHRTKRHPKLQHKGFRLLETVQS